MERLVSEDIGGIELFDSGLGFLYLFEENVGELVELHILTRDISDALGNSHGNDIACLRESISQLILRHIVGDEFHVYIRVECFGEILRNGTHLRSAGQLVLSFTNMSIYN